MSRRLILSLLILALAALGGCRCANRCSYTPQRPPCSSCGDGPLPPRLTPAPVPRRSPPLPGSTELPPPPPGTPGGNQPPATFDPPRVTEKRDSAKVPESKEPPVAAIPNKPDPAPVDDKDTPPPIELPGFAIARPNVASGLKPFTDGITWLKKHGYKTVLHLREPGENTAAAKRLYEAKGLTYLSLEASPARLSKELVAAFAKIVEDKKNQPLFVYDKDGSVAGGLWYLYNRINLKQTDEKARAEATRLGLRTDEDDAEHKTMWIAIEALLKKMKKEDEEDK